MNQNPNTTYSIPPPNDPYYSYYPNLYSAPPDDVIRPPGVDSYPPSSSSSVPLQVPVFSYAPVATSGYYLDPNYQNWAAKETVRQYGSDPALYSAAANATIPQNGTQLPAIAQAGSVVIPQNGTQLPAIEQPGSTVWDNVALQLQGNGISNKRQKKTKVVQSAYCEVCKVECTSNEVLDQHKLGKKHKKNLVKLQEAAVGTSTSSVSQNPLIGPQPNPNEGQRNKKKASASLEDIETKRRKIVEGGAAQEAVRVCAICNVVCNSERVYNYHLTGRKHASMLKKQGVTMVAAT